MSNTKSFSVQIEFNPSISTSDGKDILEKAIKDLDGIKKYKIKYKIREKEGNVVVFNNVALPVLFHESFTNPDWEKLIEFYPTYVNESESTPLDFPIYCEKIAKELEIRKCRGNRNYKEWLKIMIRYIGYSKFEKICIDYKKLVN